MKKHEYKEGPKAKQEFERAMTALFQSPKSTGAKKIKKKIAKGKD